MINKNKELNRIKKIIIQERKNMINKNILPREKSKLKHNLDSNAKDRIYGIVNSLKKCCGQ